MFDILALSSSKNFLNSSFIQVFTDFSELSLNVIVSTGAILC